MAQSFDALVKRTTSKKVRARAARRAHTYLARMLLSEVRKLNGMSQKDLADVLGIRQPSLSKLENQNDMQISTLQRIVQALGGGLVILARFPNSEIRLTQFQPDRRKSSRTVRELELVA